MDSVRIKKLAKKLKGTPAYAGKKHGQILDAIVKALGHKSWNHYCATVDLSDTPAQTLDQIRTSVAPSRTDQIRTKGGHDGFDKGTRYSKTLGLGDRQTYKRKTTK